MDRRTLLGRLVAGLSLVAAVGFSFPFLRSLVPALRQEITLDVDVTGLKPGDMKKINWLGRSVLLVTREVQAGVQEHLLFYANCTHLGCEVARNEKGGFTCPCHNSEFDGAGRVMEGSAAKLDLEAPEYRYAGQGTIRLFQARS